MITDGQAQVLAARMIGMLEKYEKAEALAVMTIVYAKVIKACECNDDNAVNMLREALRNTSKKGSIIRPS